jgi:hypothetical protein
MNAFDAGRRVSHARQVSTSNAIAITGCLLASSCGSPHSERPAPPRPVAPVHATVVSFVDDLSCPDGKPGGRHVLFSVHDDRGASLGLGRERGAGSTPAQNVCVGDEYLVDFVRDDAANRDFTGWCINYSSFMPAFDGFVRTQQRLTSGRERSTACPASERGGVH